MKHIYKDYYLDTDKYNYILCKRCIRQQGKNKGSEYFEEIGYYGTNIKMLFKRLIELKVHEHIENEKYGELLSAIQQILDAMKDLEYETKNSMEV